MGAFHHAVIARLSERGVNGHDVATALQRCCTEDPGTSPSRERKRGIANGMQHDRRKTCTLPECESISRQPIADAMTSPSPIRDV